MNRRRSLFVLLALAVPQLSLTMACDPEEPVQVEENASTGGMEAMAVADHRPRKFSHHEHGRHGGIEAKFRAWDSDGDGKVALSDLPESKRERFAAADTDRDGSITLGELQVAREERRKAMDTDGDGTISKEEWRVARKARHEARFVAMDKDGDGEINASEAGQRWELLSRADADNNGKVTRQEIETAMANKRLHDHRGKRHRKGHGPRGKGKAFQGKGPRGGTPTQ